MSKRSQRSKNRERALQKAYLKGRDDAVNGLSQSNGDLHYKQDSALRNKYKLGHKHSVEEMLEIDRFHDEVAEDILLGDVLSRSLENGGTVIRGTKNEAKFYNQTTVTSGV